MKKQSIVSFILAVMAFCSISNASITNAVWWDDGDGALRCRIVTYQSISDAEAELTMTGDQYAGPGHMLGDIYTSSAEDPTLMVRSAVDNDTTFAWVAYHVNVSMSQSFTLSLPVVYTPGDWTSVITQQPILIGSEYVGQLDYYSGTPVAISGTLDFSYKMTFTGSAQYGFCQEMIPVPEPTAYALFGLGLVSLIAARRRKNS